MLGNSIQHLNYGSEKGEAETSGSTSAVVEPRGAGGGVGRLKNARKKGEENTPRFCATELLQAGRIACPSTGKLLSSHLARPPSFPFSSFPFAILRSIETVAGKQINIFI